jgi:hypothetical protein
MYNRLGIRWVNDTSRFPRLGEIQHLLTEVWYFSEIEFLELIVNKAQSIKVIDIELVREALEKLVRAEFRRNTIWKLVKVLGPKFIKVSNTLCPASMNHPPKTHKLLKITFAVLLRFLPEENDDKHSLMKDFMMLE